jgi:hypothetical protein
MSEFVDLGGTTPPMEPCAQVGSHEYDYLDKARKEAKAYMNLLRRMFGSEPEGTRFSMKSHPHDFGTYLTVVCFFDPNDKAAAEYAQKCESEGPSEWDEAARAELGLTERSSL